MYYTIWYQRPRFGHDGLSEFSPAGSWTRDRKLGCFTPVLSSVYHWFTIDLSRRRETCGYHRKIADLSLIYRWFVRKLGWRVDKQTFLRFSILRDRSHPTCWLPAGWCATGQIYNSDAFHRLDSTRNLCCRYRSGYHPVQVDLAHNWPTYS